DSLSRVRQGWRAALSGEEPPRGSPASECASLLLARAIWGRTLADRLPLAAPLAAPPGLKPPEGVLAGWREGRSAAEAKQPEPLVSALRDATQRETAWFADDGAWRGWLAPVRAEAWRRWQDERADELETLAERLLRSQPAAQARLAERAAQP